MIIEVKEQMSKVIEVQQAGGIGWDLVLDDILIFFRWLIMRKLELIVGVRHYWF